MRTKAPEVRVSEGANQVAAAQYTHYGETEAAVPVRRDNESDAGTGVVQPLPRAYGRSRDIR